MCTALPLIEIYLHMKFQNDISNTFKDMLRTRIKLQNKQRAITQKIQNQELWFLCTALALDVIYSPMKFQVDISYTFKDMLRTRIKLQNKQRAITQKIQSQEL